MIETLNAILENISRRLFDDSLNYETSFLVTRCEGMAGASLEDILAAATGRKVMVGGSEPASESEVMETMKDALTYQGDDGSHPGRDYLASMAFKKDAELAMSQLKTLVGGSSKIVSFWLKEGHPFYPVFWDFAFVAEQNYDAIVIIGSSSD